MVDAGITTNRDKRQEEGQNNKKRGAGERKMVGQTGQEKRGLRNDQDKDPKHGLTGRQKWGTVYVGVSKSTETEIQRRWRRMGGREKLGCEPSASKCPPPA